jgi:hypothetical protein
MFSTFAIPAAFVLLGTSPTTASSSEDAGSKTRSARPPRPVAVAPT